MKNKLAFLFTDRVYTLEFTMKRPGKTSVLVPATVEARNKFHARVILWGFMRKYGVRYCDIRSCISDATPSTDVNKGGQHED